MKRLFLRIGVLAITVVLGLIAYAYAQRDSGDRPEYTSPNYTINPLRDNLLRAGPASDNSSEKKTVVDSRVTKVASVTPVAETASRPAGDPFGLASHKSGSPSDQSIPQTLPSNGIPDASALDSAMPKDSADQSQDPRLVGPNLNGPNGAAPGPDGRSGRRDSDDALQRQNPSTPQMVERYPSKANSSDRSVAAGNSPDRYAGQSAGTRSSFTGSQEPAPFETDPFSSPTALSQNPDRGRQRNIGPDSGNVSDGTPASSEGAGRPGSKQIEGAQTPQITVQKFAPAEIQVGKPAVFKVAVRNTGSIPAGQVEIQDQVPRGTKLLGTTPRAAQGSRGVIVWNIGTLRPGEESVVEMQLMPTAEGEIGSVATVHFGADASARTIATKPQLAVEMSAQGKVLIGEQVMLSITVSNPGTGVATGVVLEERIPKGLQHPAGTELEYEVGDLRPGESKKLDLPLAAVAPGKALNVLIARADGNLETEEHLELQVVAPKLDIAMDGPKRRFLEREAVYQVSLNNPGTAAAQQVELVAYLPQGLKFISANNSGHYDEVNRAVHWRLEELPCNETGTVELVTMPVAAGQQSIKLRGTAERGLAVEAEQPVMVEGIAAVRFQPVDVTGPVEVGAETVYEIHVVNQGSKAAGNVQLAVTLPPEMQPISAEGPSRHAIQGNRIIFESLASLAPKADTNYRIRVKSIRPGDLHTRFQLLTDGMQTPVTKEESTRVYADE